MKRHIFFFGDSICFGQFISPHHSWVTRISYELHKLNDDIVVFNTSHSGDTTRMALEKMPFDVQGHGIDTILIQFGINDSNLWVSDGGLPRVSPMAYEGNLLEIIDRAKAFGAKRVFINTNHPTNKNVVYKGKEIPHQIGNSRYNTIIRKVAKQSGAQLIDIEKEFLKRMRKGKGIEHYLLEDGIHLNNNGHDLYFEIVFPFLKKSFSK